MSREFVTVTCTVVLRNFQLKPIRAAEFNPISLWPAIFGQKSFDSVGEEGGEEGGSAADRRNEWSAAGRSPGGGAERAQWLISFGHFRSLSGRFCLCSVAGPTFQSGLFGRGLSVQKCL